MGAQSHRQRGAYSFGFSIPDSVTSQETETVTGEALQQPHSSFERPIYGPASAKNTRLTRGAWKDLAAAHAGSAMHKRWNTVGNRWPSNYMFTSRALNRIIGINNSISLLHQASLPKRSES